MPSITNLIEDAARHLDPRGRTDRFGVLGGFSGRRDKYGVVDATGDAVQDAAVFGKEALRSAFNWNSAPPKRKRKPPAPIRRRT